MSEMYTGVWFCRDDNGRVIKSKGVTFDRIFRGYRFTDEECQALLQGYYVDAKNIESHGVRYTVRGKLEETIIHTEKCVHKTIRFKALDMPVSSYETEEDIPDAGDDEGGNIREAYEMDRIMNEMEDEDAELAAMIEQPEYSDVKKVSKRNEPPKYAPVVSFGID